MTRHSKNCTSGAVYSYHERHKDTKSSQYGSKEVRVGQDSIKRFDCCCLSNQPCVDPVVTPDGHLYEREAILESMLQQRKEIKRKMVEFERQRKQESEKEAELQRLQHEADVKKYLEVNSVAKAEAVPSSAAKDLPGTALLSNMANAKANNLPSFWVPSLTPSATNTGMQKPDEKIRCPMSRKPLKMKDLISIKFTPAPKADQTAGVKYICPVTKDSLTNSSQLYVLRTSGSVVVKDAVEKLIRKDMIDPMNGKALTESDIIPLTKGSSGFAASGHSLTSKGKGVVLQA